MRFVPQAKGLLYLLGLRQMEWCVEEWSLRCETTDRYPHDHDCAQERRAGDRRPLAPAEPGDASKGCLWCASGQLGQHGLHLRLQQRRDRTGNAGGRDRLDLEQHVSLRSRDRGVSDARLARGGSSSKCICSIESG